jgi:hypothetical protein
MNSQLTPLAVPIAEAQRMLGGISRTAVYELARNDRLKKIRIGRRGLIVVASINALVTHLADTQPSNAGNGDVSLAVSAVQTVDVAQSPAAGVASEQDD